MGDYKEHIADTEQEVGSFQQSTPTRMYLSF